MLCLLYIRICGHHCLDGRSCIFLPFSCFVIYLCAFVCLFPFSRISQFLFRFLFALVHHLDLIHVHRFLVCTCALPLLPSLLLSLPLSIVVHFISLLRTCAFWIFLSGVVTLRTYNAHSESTQRKVCTNARFFCLCFVFRPSLHLLSVHFDLKETKPFVRSLRIQITC